MINLLLNPNIMTISVWQSLKDFLAASLEWLFSITSAIGLPSYALAIVIFTILVKLILYPLSLKQMRSMREMQRIQPLVKELDTKYKNDPKLKQEKMMEIYKEHKINPFGGCLPLLIQMPILIALFTTLREFAPKYPEFYTFFWITDLSQPDPTKLVLPIIVGLSTFAQQYVSMTNKEDTTQKAMLYMMPIMLGWFTVKFAAGLAIYWVCFNILGAIQQYYINKKSMPVIEVPVKTKGKGKKEKANK